MSKGNPLIRSFTRQNKRTGTQYPILENLFNSKIRVKVLKFLFRNYPANVGVKDLAGRIQESYAVVKQEMMNLEKMGLVKKI